MLKFWIGIFSCYTLATRYVQYAAGWTFFLMPRINRSYNTFWILLSLIANILVFLIRENIETQFFYLMEWFCNLILNVFANTTLTWGVHIYEFSTVHIFSILMSHIITEIKIHNFLNRRIRAIIQYVNFMNMSRLCAIP